MFKKIMLWLAGIIVLGGVVFALGPRESADETITFNASSLGEDLDSYLAGNEGKIPDIIAGAEKKIVWQNYATKVKTEYSVVYIHGFSATLEEVRPLPDIIAGELGANLFYTRLAGHGRGNGPAMGEASANDWFNDAAEALAIGRAIGEKVILISTSTGGTIVSWALTKPELAKDVVASVMLSPNFGVNDPGAKMLSLPWARQILPKMFGETRSWEPRNEGQAKWWSTSYPSVSLLPMQASVDLAAKLPFEEMTVPALFMFHPEDGVVNSSLTKEIAGRWGKNGSVAVEVVEAEDATDTMKHVIAGRILSPANTEPLARKALNWISGL